jgi:hypothetical protein
MVDGDGFLSRWSRRKQALKAGREVPPEPEVAAGPPPVEGETGAASSQAPADAGASEASRQAAAAPTLDDVQALTPQSDFRRFVSPQVAPDVKNAAMKKLFADPHFNVMDGLDVYIDDYAKPDPLPPEMLRQMVSARFLKLFDDGPEEAAEAAAAAEAKAAAAPATDEPEAQATAAPAPDAPGGAPRPAEASSPDEAPAPTPGPAAEGPGTAP